VLTKSEILFLEYCNLRGYVANRLSAPTDGGRFPDYELVIGTNRIVAEIKEFRANPADRNMTGAIQEGRIQVFGDEIGRRVRTHIEDAERQLRRYESQQVPCLVVLYDDIVVNGSRPNPPGLFPVDVMNPLYPGHVEVGMYGHQVAQVRLHPDGRTESLGDTRGGKRTLRSGHQNNISAVATLHDYDSKSGLYLIVYHNFFAKNPLPKSVFTDSKDRQIEKPGHPDSCPGSLQRVQI
jgi:hypothetical protein